MAVSEAMLTVSKLRIILVFLLNHFLCQNFPPRICNNRKGNKNDAQTLEKFVTGEEQKQQEMSER